MIDLSSATSNWLWRSTSKGTSPKARPHLRRRWRHSRSEASLRTTSELCFKNLNSHEMRKSLSGELLLDQQLFEDAVEKFDRAIQMEGSKLVYFARSMTSFAEL